MLLCPAALSGCGAPAGPATVQVTGTVTYNGKPIDAANVIFYPSDANELVSQSATDPDGRFQLSSHVGGGKFKAGIVPGQYAVAITKLDVAGISNTLAPPKNMLPKKYGSPKTSPLTADVAAGTENNFEFPLTDK
jgi:hypothetical protein